LRRGVKARLTLIENTTENTIMNYHEMDAIFPFVVWGYGGLLLLVIHGLTYLGDRVQGLSAVWAARLRSREVLAWICFWVGGLWSLQELWFH
jgi:hypothetical protein